MNSRPTGSGRSPSSSARSSRPPRPGSISRRRRSMGDGTPLGRVRGIGSANHGTGHWLQQRFTALGNLLLVTWFVVSLIRLPLTDHGAVLRWASNPTVAPALIDRKSAVQGKRGAVRVGLGGRRLNNKKK